MCDLVQITVTLIHPANGEEEAAHAIGIKGVLNVQSGSADVPAEGSITVPELIDAIVTSLPHIATAIEREWSIEWAVRREQTAQQN